MSLITAGITDIGCVRRSNEDSIGLFQDLDLYVVADGMGGHAAGEVASKMAVDQIEQFLKDVEKTESASTVSEKKNNQSLLANAIASANQKIYNTSLEDASLNGMGTTVVALLAKPDEVELGFVGDSRVYLYQNNGIQQLTKDHSLVNEYVKRGLLAPEAVATHPQKHVLSRALGTGVEVEVETCKRVPCPGDIYLLCSDGLSNKLSSTEMESIVMETKGNIEEAGRKLVHMAKEKGGEDNISVVLVGYLA
ncbi:MAG: Stp1/IreP family PP2C-type Ser/Thr phosphatase [Waddliaceae bacterium]